jgi:hypothetical protein
MFKGATVTAAESPIPRAIAALHELFTAKLHDVRFPDVDGAVLAKACADVTNADDVVRALETQLLEAQRTLDDAQDALALRSQRALAYLRIYAEGNPELEREVSSIVVPRTARQRSTPPLAVAAPAPVKKRGRKAVGDTHLFDAGAEPAHELASSEQAA